MRLIKVHSAAAENRNYSEKASHIFAVSSVIVRTGVSGWWVFGAERRPAVSDINVMLLGPILLQCPNISGTWSSSTEPNVYNIYQDVCLITAEYEVRNIDNKIHGFATEEGFAYVTVSTNKYG